MNPRRNIFTLVALALTASACEGHPRVIGDGWHYEASASDRRALLDSMLGLASGDPSVSYVGIGEKNGSAEPVMRSTSGAAGGKWARDLMAWGPLSVVIGHPGSAATSSAARLYAAAGLPLVSPNATARSESAVEEWVFRLLPDDAAQGAFLADYALDSLAAARVAVVFVGDAYGVGILAGVRAGLARRGQPLADEIELPIGACTPADPLAAPTLATRALIRRSRPDVIIVALPLIPANCVVAEVLRAQRGIAILGTDALDQAHVDEWVRKNAAQADIRVATGWLPRTDAATEAFTETFTRRSGMPPAGADALHHDALLVAAAAVRETDGSPARVRAWLASLGVSRSPVQGLTGPISFESNRSAVRLFMRGVR